jgi:hypothetical protein
VLTEVYQNELHEYLTELRQRYGDHPILIETEADFLDDPARRVELYRDAVTLAERNALPTYTIYLSWAADLLREFLNPTDALSKLRMCESDIKRHGHTIEREQWEELFQACSST